VKLFKEKISGALSFVEYYRKIESLLSESKTSGINHSEALVSYTQLNMQRMNRLLKTIELDPELTDIARNFGRNLGFIVLAEAWCGDVAQNLPIIHKIIKLNPSWKMHILWRDENLDLMNEYLTNAAISIPKVIIFDAITFEELAVWGPRPAILQDKVMAYKADPKDMPYSEFVESVHLWYAKDKGKNLQLEWKEIIGKIVSLS